MLVLVVVGIVRCGPRWATALLAQLSWVMPLIAIMDTSHSASDRIGALQGVQGRYLFVGVAALAATIGVAFGGRSATQDQSSQDSPSQNGVTGSTALARSYALLPLIALITAALGLAAGVAHFYVGNGFSGEVGTLSAWSPLRLRVLVPIGVHLCRGRARRRLDRAPRPPPSDHLRPRAARRLKEFRSAFPRRDATQFPSVGNEFGHHETS